MEPIPRSHGWRARLARRLPNGWARLASFAPPVVVYTLWAIGVSLPFGNAHPLASAGGDAPSTVLGAYLTTLAATALTTLFVYLLYCFSWAPRTGARNPIAGLLLIALCGVGLLAIAVPARGLPLLGLAIHVARSPSGTRLLTVVEYGCTGLSLSWFHAYFEGVGILPWGIPIALAQGAMLLLFEGDRKLELEAQARDERN